MAWIDLETGEVREAYSKENFESFLGDGKTVTDEQWKVISSDIQSIIDVALDENLYKIAEDIEDGIYFGNEGEN